MNSVHVHMEDSAKRAEMPGAGPDTRPSHPVNINYIWSWHQMVQPCSQLVFAGYWGQGLSVHLERKKIWETAQYVKDSQGKDEPPRWKGGKHLNL